MMAVVVESCITDNYLISIEIEVRYGNSYYKVQTCPKRGDDMYGYPEREMGYSMDEKKKAYATYRRYKKKYI